MDPNPNYAPTATSNNEPAPPAFTATQIVRQLEGVVGPLSMKRIEEIDSKTMEALRNATRATRIAWFSDYRRALKKARKTGRPVEAPEL